MNLLDVFRKTKKASAPHNLGRMWACTVKFYPWVDSGQRYDVVIKNVGIVEAFCRNDGPRVLSDERNPFNFGTPINLAGPVGCLEYVQSANIWVGFFETEDDAKKEYCQFVNTLVDEIKSASSKV